MKPFALYLLLGSFLAPLIKFVEKYVYSDWDYLMFLAVIIFADTMLGVAKAIIRKEVSSRKMLGFFHKVIVYAGALVTTHVLVNFTVANKPYPVFTWFDSVVFGAIMVREAISIFENIAAIDPGVFPPSLLKYLKQFDSLTGKEKLPDNPTEETV